MSYRFGVVRGENFGPYAKFEFDLSGDGLTAVEGLMIGHDGCTSNGSGKSYVIETVIWVSYGRCLRPALDADGVMRLLYAPDDKGILQVVRTPKGVAKKPKGGTWVEMNLNPLQVDLPPVQAIQYRNHPIHKNNLMLFIDGENVTRGRNKDTRDLLIQIIGMDYDTFCNTVAFACRDDVKSFYLLEESARKEVLESLLGVSIYARAAKHTAELLRSVNATLQPKQESRIRLQTLVEERSNTIVPTPDDIESRWIRWSGAAWEVWQHRARRNVVALEQSVAERAYDAVHERIQELEVAHESRERESNRIYRKVAQKVSSLNRTHGIVQARMLDLEDRIESVSEKKGEPCITCGHKMGASHIARAVASLQSELDDAQVAEQEAFALLGAAEVEQEEAQEALDSIPQLEIPSSEEEYARMQVADTALGEYEDDLEIHRGRAHRVKLEYTNAVREVETHQKGLEKVQADLVAIEETIKDIEVEVEDLRVCTEMFGNGGLKSFLIEMTLPQINQVASKYARRLCGAGASVALSATTTLKSGATREKLDVVANIPGCAETYAQASKGQKRRLDLALLLAFRETAEKKSSGKLSQCFVDELFDGLDDAGCGVIVEILREVSAKCPVTYLTHDAKLKSAADRVWLARHENGISTLDTGAKKKVTKKRVRRKVKNGS